MRHIVALAFAQVAVGVGHAPHVLDHADLGRQLEVRIDVRRELEPVGGLAGRLLGRSISRSIVVGQRELGPQGLDHHQPFDPIEVGSARITSISITAVAAAACLELAHTGRGRRRLQRGEQFFSDLSIGALHHSSGARGARDLL